MGQTSGDPIRVLEVDDDPEFGELVATFLEREDERLEVTVETSAAEGLARLDGRTEAGAAGMANGTRPGFDCVVSDYQMPGMDGLEFLAAVRDRYPDVPFILFTAEGSEEVASEAISADATDYLGKGRGTQQYELLANRIVNVVEQERATRRAAELERIRALVAELDRALVRASSREGLETDVCEIINDTEPYCSAWIGEVDPETDRVEPRASAGAVEGYLEEVTITADDRPTGQGPAGTAIRERRVVVSHDTRADPDFEPWREVVVEHGIRSAAAVPLDHGGVLHGLLVVYTDRAYAFSDEERALLAELGDNVAHALHAVELRAEHERHATVVEALGDPVYVLDADGVVVTVNAATLGLTGYSRDELLGEHVSDVLEIDDIERGDALIEASRAGEAHVGATHEAVIHTASGGEIPCEVRLSRLPPTSDGSTGGFVGVARDVTERRRREERLETLHAATRELLQAGDRAEILTVGSRAMARIAGLDTNSIRLYDPGTDALTVVERSERSRTLLGASLVPYDPGSTPAGRAYTSGEVVVDSVTADDLYGREPLTECAYVPLGEHGVFSVGTAAAGGLTDDALAVAEILASNLTSVLDHHEDERELRDREEKLEALLGATRELMAATSTEAAAEIASDAVQEVIDLPVNAVRLYDPEENALAPEAITDVTEQELGERPAYDVETSPAGRSYRTGETVISEVGSEDRYDRAPLVESLYVPLGGHGILSLGTFSADGFDDVTVRTAEVFAANFEAALDRTDYEERIETLHDATRRLMTATTAQEVAERTAAAAEEALGYPNNVVRLVDETGTRLRPAAVTQAARVEMGERPVYEVGDGPVGEVYARGAPRIYDDIRTVDDGHDRGEARAVMYVPLGSHGTIGIADTASTAFGQSDLHLASVLAANAETALDRIDRERDLQRQNERLDEFAGVVSHDLRNPLNVAQGRLELARGECDSEHLEAVGRAHDRMEALIDGLLTLAREGETVAEVAPVDLADLAERCWRDLDSGDATLHVETTVVVRADRGRLRQVLANLLRNAVEHGGEGVTVTIGDLDAGSGFYVEDDGPGIPVDRRADVVETGYTTAGDGTGLGLSIVEQVVQAHGWELEVTESPSGGARFDVAGVDIGG